MFSKVGSVRVKLGEVRFADPRFDEAGPDAFDICIHCENTDVPGESDWCKMEYSGRYGKGNFSDRTQIQITMKILHGLGFEGQDLTTIGEQLKDKVVSGKVVAGKANAKGEIYNNIYLDGGPAEIDNDQMKARMVALSGSGAATAAPLGANPMFGPVDEGKDALNKPLAGTSPGAAAAKAKAAATTGTSRPNPFAPKK